jgi:hypothetical protein
MLSSGSPTDAWEAAPGPRRESDKGARRGAHKLTETS